jgi:hypothetical protein
MMKRHVTNTAPLRRLGRVLSAMLIVVGMGASQGGALAQAVDCSRLAQQISALGMPGAGTDPARAQQFRDAANRQQSELDRTSNYASSIGCGRRQFLFFGDAPPRECGQIEQQIARMRGNLSELRQQAQQAGGGDEARRELTARYDASCRGGQQQRGGGFFDALFGGGARTPRDVPVDGEPAAPTPEETGPSGGALAVCVRTCDGGFFPVSYSANRARYQELGELCQAMCPNVETQLFTMSMGREIEQSVGVDGKPYTSLPNAGKFRTKYDSACTCKKADQSWVEALGNAEKMLGRDSRRDQIVTPERAAELSRPQAAKTPVAAKPGAKPDPRAAARSQRIEQEIAAEAASGAEAPTASRDSAGIAAGGVNNGSNYSLRDGATRDAKSADGATRRVRTVGPQL